MILRPLATNNINGIFLENVPYFQYNLIFKKWKSLDSRSNFVPLIPSVLLVWASKCFKIRFLVPQYVHNNILKWHGWSSNTLWKKSSFCQTWKTAKSGKALEKSVFLKIWYVFMKNVVNIVCSQESEDHFDIKCLHVTPAVLALERAVWFLSEIIVFTL